MWRRTDFFFVCLFKAEQVTAPGVWRVTFILHQVQWQREGVASGGLGLHRLIYNYPNHSMKLYF